MSFELGSYGTMIWPTQIQGLHCPFQENKLPAKFGMESALKLPQFPALGGAKL
jgi:hypothetical protein